MFIKVYNKSIKLTELGVGVGDVCMVSVLEDKRRAEANSLAMLVKDVHRAEIGVCLGYSRTSPGH